MLNVEPQKSSPVSTVSIGRMESVHCKSRLDKKLSWGIPASVSVGEVNNWDQKAATLRSTNAKSNPKHRPERNRV